MKGIERLLCMIAKCNISTKKRKRNKLSFSVSKEDDLLLFPKRFPS